MATYSVKLCDHTGSPTSVTQGIQQHLQGFFDRVFNGTPDNASILWGRGSLSDDIVLHFVEDVGSSYIVNTMPKPPKINPFVGGHTTLRGHVTCSEFYKTVTKRGGGNRAMSGRDYARLAFHECLHNVFPGWEEKDLMGHGGLAETPVGPDLNQWDTDTMRRGIAIKSVATQKL